MVGKTRGMAQYLEDEKLKSLILVGVEGAREVSIWGGTRMNIVRHKIILRLKKLNNTLSLKEPKTANHYTRLRNLAWFHSVF